MSALIIGKHNTAVSYAEQYTEEDIAQVKDMCNLPFLGDAHIRMMPDMHKGAGCVIGTTMRVNDNIVSNFIGVDIGCLDRDTQVLTPDGWKYISEYDGSNILVYDATTGNAFFSKPYAYINEPCDWFYELKAKNGLNQRISSEHKVLLWRGYAGKGFRKTIQIAEELVNSHNSLKKGINGGVNTVFQNINRGLSIPDEMIRVWAMVSADGCIRRDGKDNSRFIEVHLKKSRKIDRAKKLLSDAKIDFTIYIHKDGTETLAFRVPGYIGKSLSPFFRANSKELSILSEESLHWDGTIGRHNYYSTTSKTNADVIQFAFASSGIRCGIYAPGFGRKDKTQSYMVYTTKNTIVALPPRKIEKIPSEDGRKYCFTTETGFFVIRRGDCISITGNCGVLVSKIPVQTVDFDALDAAIREHIPIGKNVRDLYDPATSSAYGSGYMALLANRWGNLDADYTTRSVGTLGGGNHYIEVGRSEATGDLYISVHSGSRKFGHTIATNYQDLAYKTLKERGFGDVVAQLKAEGRHKEIQATLNRLRAEVPDNIDKDTAYLTGKNMSDYMRDMSVASNFATFNRMIIVLEIFKAMGWPPNLTFDTRHNYIDIAPPDGGAPILRKGAVSAKAGEKFIIPLNMRDGSLICVGKGNPEWNYSAPHGAGRIMSRRKAREEIGLDNYRETMEAAGVFTTSISADTLDEAPFAYKDSATIANAIKPTAEIVDRLIPVYSLKAGGDD